MRIDSAAQCSVRLCVVRMSGDVCESGLARSQGIHTHVSCNGLTAKQLIGPSLESASPETGSRVKPSRCALLEMAAATQELKNSIQVKLEQSGEYDRCARPPLVERALLSPRSVRRDA